MCVVCSMAADAMAQISPYRPETGYPRFEAKQEEPGVSYGSPPEFTLPKTLIYSVSVDELNADAEAWVDAGYGGFFLTGIAGEWSVDIWGVDGQPWTAGESDETLLKTREAVARARALGADVFLTTAFSHLFDWFDDVAWQHIEHRFRQMALFGRASGCTGLAIDIEYINQQYHFVWDGYTYDTYNRRELVDTIRARMTRVAAAMYDAWPEMVLLTLPEHFTDLGGHIQRAWIEEAARRNAPGGFHVCTEYSYRRPNLRFMLGHAWMIHDLYRRTLSPSARRYWRANGSVAEGIWVFGDDPDDFHGAAPTASEFRQAFAASLMAGARYNWIYSHNVRPFFLGRESDQGQPPADLQAYRDAIANRDIVVDEKYLDVGAALRAVDINFDYETALGLTIVPTFAAPREQIEIGLMPVDRYLPSRQSALREELWDIGLAIHRGETPDLQKRFHTQTEWMIAGPFDNTANAGFDAVYPPEENIALDAQYDTLQGTVAWQRYQSPKGSASVNLADVFDTTDWSCAYALCFVESSVEQAAEIRVGANDCWKLWVDGRCVMDYPEVGRIVLDREVVPVTFKAGGTPVLLKVCNGQKDFGFIARFTDSKGQPLRNIQIRTRP
jgi:hypothetical protein